MSNIKTKIQQLSLFALCALTLASCADLDIVKRRYRPGYHIDFTKKKDKPQPSETTAKVDKPVAAPENRIGSKEVILSHPKPEAELTTASTSPALPVVEKHENRSTRIKAEDRKIKRSDFRWSAKKKKRHAKKPMFTSSDHWSAWVSFFTGAAGATFGIIAFIVAFFGIAVWPAAIVFGVAAIVFAVINIKNGWSGQEMRRWGMILGIVGAGLGVLSIIIWAIWFFAIL